MSKLLKSLLAATAVLAIAPSAAWAIPQYCSVLCDFEADCSETCYDGRITTCGAYGVYGTCIGARSEVTDSVAQGEAQRSDASSLVCSEAQRSEAQAASVEG